MKRSVTNVRSLFSERNRNSYLSLVLFERQQITKLHLFGCQNKCDCHVTDTACPISKSLRFRSVINFRVATKILFYQNSITILILFHFNFCVPLSSIKSYNNSSKVFSRSEQETGKRKHKEPPSIREAKKFHSLHRFRYNSSPSELARVTVSRPYRRPSGAGGDINSISLCVASNFSFPQTSSELVKGSE